MKQLIRKMYWLLPIRTIPTWNF